MITMGGIAKGKQGRVLAREARVPLIVAERPCILVGISLAMVMAFAGMDALLWQRAAQHQVVEISQNHESHRPRVVGKASLELDRVRFVNSLLEAERRQLLREIAELRHLLCVRDGQCVDPAVGPTTRPPSTGGE